MSCDELRLGVRLLWCSPYVCNGHDDALRLMMELRDMPIPSDVLVDHRLGEAPSTSSHVGIQPGLFVNTE
jgi:hypothetical protein